MMNLNWRAFAGIGALLAVVVIAANVTFSFMGMHGAPNGASNGYGYGPGAMMGTWMWGGIGFFWIVPIAVFLLMLLFVANTLALGQNRRPSAGAPAVAPPAEPREEHG